jgi:APA family basic amino acid/polyamine antiporter
MVRGRSAGAAIVSEAKRRGVEAIVLAAEEPTRVRGGAVLGGRGRVRDRFVGETTRYVVNKAPCRVILTAPPADRYQPVDGQGRAPDLMGPRPVSAEVPVGHPLPVPHPPSHTVDVDDMPGYAGGGGISDPAAGTSGRDGR